MSLDEWTKAVEEEFKVRTSLYTISQKIDAEKEYASDSVFSTFGDHLSEKGWLAGVDDTEDGLNEFIQGFPLVPFSGPTSDREVLLPDERKDSETFPVVTVQSLHAWEDLLAPIVSDNIEIRNMTISKEVDAMAKEWDQQEGDDQRLDVQHRLLSLVAKLNEGLSRAFERARKFGVPTTAAVDKEQMCIASEHISVSILDSVLSKEVFFETSPKLLPGMSNPIWVTSKSRLDDILENKLDYEERARSVFNHLGLENTRSKSQFRFVFNFSVEKNYLSNMLRKPTLFSGGYQNSYASFKCSMNWGRTVDHKDGNEGGYEALVPRAVLLNSKLEISILGYIPSTYRPQEGRPASYHDTVGKRC